MTSPALPPARPSGLDEAAFTACERLRAAGIPAPRALFLMATGVGFLPSRLSEGQSLELGEVAPEETPWSGVTLHAGRLGSLPVWCLEDVSGEPVAGEAGGAGWRRVFPVWLAAAAGCELCLHTSAGSTLSRPDGRPFVAPGNIALVRDHINLSGSSPLVGLGESKLGPLFPDLSRLHDAGLRRAARIRCQELGIPAAEAIVACTLGPALETPAERAALAHLGAELAVQSLAAPLLAAAHAGLRLLALVAVTDRTSGAAELLRILEAARALQPALEDLLLALGPDLSAAVAELAAREEA
jgi:purine-nucleoside phosphorylase